MASWTAVLPTTQLQAMEAIVKTLQKLDIEQWQLSLFTSHHKDPA